MFELVELVGQRLELLHLVVDHFDVLRDSLRCIQDRLNVRGAGENSAPSNHEVYSDWSHGARLSRLSISRVRHPQAARVLGIIRRVILSLSNAALDRLRKRQPKTKANTYRQRFLSVHQGAQRLTRLIFCKTPDVLSFPK